ncbi:hypothetical protein PAXRUDRAFT_601693 [Paxillus rubicundulus Ve08.2h10]|uniref:Uncharacterized protein n=1 Tax=Paxillus rubicundulus Ve08.2h10 TaxID=930991 RepID=A0A0D0D5Q0_9AGAM|nr:hypothetical protein PAXRUDRAFT_601693 [Paxillus rubicundulus Ve08.2h10]
MIRINYRSPSAVGRPVTERHNNPLLKHFHTHICLSSRNQKKIQHTASPERAPTCITLLYHLLCRSVVHSLCRAISIQLATYVSLRVAPFYYPRSIPPSSPRCSARSRVTIQTASKDELLDI